MNKYIKIGIILGIYLLIMLIVFFNIDRKGKDKNKDTKKITYNKQYIIFDNYLLLEKNGDKYSELPFESGDYLKKKFYTFINDSYSGEYYYRNINSDIYLFDDENNSIDYTGEVMLNTFSKKMSTCKLSKKNLNSSDESIAIKVLKKYNIDDAFDINNSNFIKYECDIDNDGNLENIYILNGEIEFLLPKFSMIFYTKNNVINPISVFNDGSYNQTIMKIADIDNDNKMEILTTKTNSSTYCYQLFNISKNKVKRLMGC